MFALLCVYIVKANGFRFIGDNVSYFYKSLRQNEFGQVR